MPSIVIGTAGHIDHGKSALVKALTGTDPDRLKEEQERGITIDLGFAHTSVGDLDVAFVDVPGHERFVRNMLAGAGGIDAVLLVIAADESVMPQTREHFEICRLLGISRGLIVLTKSDLVDADTIELVTLDVRELVAGSFLAGAPILPVSARTGAGLDALRAALATLGAGRLRPARSDATRLPIDRVFTVKGFGTVVTGTLVAGRVRDGDELAVLPDDRQVRVRGVQVHGKPVAEADAPRRVALNLGAIDVHDLARGATLATPDTVPVTRRVDLRMELLANAAPLGHGSRVHVHHGTADLEGRVAVCAARTGEGPWKQAAVGDRAVAVAPGGQAYVRLRLRAPIAIARHDRVVIRAYSPAQTIGGGFVLDPLPPTSGLRRAGSLSRFEAIDLPVSGSSAEVDRRAVAVWLQEAAERGLDVSETARRAGLDRATAETYLSALTESGVAIAASGRNFDMNAVQRVEKQVVDEIAARHQRDPMDPGMPRDAMRARAAASAGPGFFDAVLDRLSRAGTTTGTDRLSLASHRGSKTPAEALASDAVEAALKFAGLTPPDIAALSDTTRLAPADVERAMQLLTREGRLARVGDLVFHTEALAKFKSDVRKLAAGRTPGDPPVQLDISTVKERYGLSRKYAIPLLEWLDRERVTRRVGTGRVIL